MGLGAHILHQWMAFAFSGKSKCNLWRPYMRLGTHILRQCMAFAWYWSAFAFPEKGNAVSRGLIWGWGPIYCISGWHLLVILLHLFLPDKANAVTGGLIGVRDPYIASEDGICLVLGCICFFRKKQMQSVEAL